MAKETPVKRSSQVFVIVDERGRTHVVPNASYSDPQKYCQDFNIKARKVTRRMPAA